ncbi:hypothetical protein NDU88_004842 [Pleurodeles waltl]|uniref:Uncharacterized protein n=1 Tax=Pleurodeles waltl TaxID=8319 RepID=A0AAV7WX39_PLEWA|nr:hypothetical protein NDU88_004842 [Pleurodeles waltl]
MAWHATLTCGRSRGLAWGRDPKRREGRRLGATGDSGRVLQRRRRCRRGPGSPGEDAPSRGAARRRSWRRAAPGEYGGRPAIGAVASRWSVGLRIAGDAGGDFLLRRRCRLGPGGSTEDALCWAAKWRYSRARARPQKGSGTEQGHERESDGAKRRRGGPLELGAGAGRPRTAPTRDPWVLTWSPVQEDPADRIKPARQKDQLVELVSGGSRPGGERRVECPVDGIADSPGRPGTPETPKRAGLSIEVSLVQLGKQVGGKSEPRRRVTVVSLRQTKGPGA